MTEFERVFGFPQAKWGQDAAQPDHNKTYGCAIYGAWSEERPGSPFWNYVIGPFDYVWGYFRASQEDPRALGFALYELDGEKAIKLIESVQMSGTWRKRYGEDDGHSAMLVDLTSLPEETRDVPPVDFAER